MDRPIIVAVDFDGILCRDEFPDIGRPNYEMISFIRRMQDSGIETILWTSRIGNKLDEAVLWCEDYGLKFTAINDNTPNNKAEYGTNPRKVFADVYIDDRCPQFMTGVNAYRDDVVRSMVKDIIKKQLGGKLI